VKDASAKPAILLLTEDRANDAHAIFAILAKKMLQLLKAGCPTHQLDFRPANDDARRAMHGNLWKSEKPRDRQKLVDLRRTIARTLNEPGEQSFVFFHIDGDRSWSKRETSENHQKFLERIRHGVEQLLAQSGRSALEIETALSRLCLVMPFYSIEAWLYQNTRAAIQICQESYNGADVERFKAWEQKRALLDEEEKPKEKTCLRDRHNLDLAKDGFPSGAVYDAGCSFAAAVDSLLDCEKLGEVLDRIASASASTRET